MKVFTVIFLVTAFASTQSYPADKVEERKEPLPNKDVDFVPLENGGSPFLPGGVVDIDVDDDGFFGNPFPSLRNTIEALMARMRQQLSQILGRLPEKPGDSPFPDLHISNDGDIDLGKGNTTSVVKVIDGHKVTINETEYKQDGENGGAFFKVRIIDVRPENGESGETDTEVTPPKKDREPVEDSSSNEISKRNEALNFDNIETMDTFDASSYKTTNRRRNTYWNNDRSKETIESNSIDAETQPFQDLSNDIYVNQLLQDKGAPVNPDAELFDVVDGRARLSSKPFAKTKMPIYRVAHFPTYHTYSPEEFGHGSFRPAYESYRPFTPMMVPPFPDHFPFPPYHAMPPNANRIQNLPSTRIHVVSNEVPRGIPIRLEQKPPLNRTPRT